MLFGVGFLTFNYVLIELVIPNMSLIISEIPKTNV